MPVADFITNLIMGFIDGYLFDEDNDEEEDDNDGEKKAPDSTTPGD